MKAQRSYAEAGRWMRAARPGRIHRLRFARRSLGRGLVMGTALMGLIGLAAPSRFASVGSRTLGTGWPSLVVIGLIALCALYAIVRREHIRSAIDRGREPFLRPLSNISGFDGAADALAACPDAFKTRFAIGWIWRPLALFGLGIVCTFSTAYFVIDAALARFRVGWGQPAYAAGFLVLGLVVFALSAVKLSTWRLAVSVYKEVTSGYRA